MNLQLEIGKAFNTHAVGYEQSAKVQYEIGERLFSRLQYLKMDPKYILDLGCGPGTFSQKIKKLYPNAQVVGFDLAYNMLIQARNKTSEGYLVNGDMMALPFSSNLFDLVFANQVVHWAPSLPLLLAELNRVMNNQGCLMFSTLGPDTFEEIKQAWSSIDTHAHANEFMDMHDIGDILLSQRFLDPVMDAERLTAHFTSCKHLIRTIKAQGVRNIHPQRKRGLTGKDAWRNFEHSIAQFCTSEGKFPLTYEVLYGHAWKAEPSQIEYGNNEVAIPISMIRKAYLAR